MVSPPLPTRTRDSCRRLRRETTDAERALWRFLRGSRLGGLKFRRQHPIPPYIADFCCIERKLIIELDGSQHTPGGDSSRTRFLHSQGWRVLRFWEHAVRQAPDACARRIGVAVKLGHSAERTRTLAG